MSYEYHSYNNSSTSSSTGQLSPSPKLEPTAASSSWMENDNYPELYRPDGTVLAKYYLYIYLHPTSPFTLLTGATIL
jgi:hypothetical protein